MKTVTATELRSNIYQLIDEVLSTGVPLEIEKSGRRVRLVAVEPVDKFAALETRAGVINGDPEALVHMEWEVDLDLP